MFHSLHYSVLSCCPKSRWGGHTLIRYSHFDADTAVFLWLADLVFLNFSFKTGICSSESEVWVSACPNSIYVLPSSTGGVRLRLRV